VELRCLLPGDADHFLWYINGTSTFLFGEEALSKQGITYSNTLLVDDDRLYGALYIEPRIENNNTELYCTFSGGYSNAVIFRVQGLLGPPTGLETVFNSSIYQALRWTDPFSLNLTDSPDDITGYSVTVTMESPPPRPPYDPSVSRDQLTATTNQTWRLYLPPLFPFPRYSFPVWLTVRAENPVGLGAPSLPLRYSPPPLDSCLRLGDLVSGDSLGSKVIFTDSGSLSVEIPLYQQPPQGDMCVDTVVVVLSAGGSARGGSASGEEETHVLVPAVGVAWLSLVLGPELLEEDTHYTASLSFPPGHLSAASFCESVMMAGAHFCEITEYGKARSSAHVHVLVPSFDCGHMPTGQEVE
jgi:hypothetical protein